MGFMLFAVLGFGPQCNQAIPSHAESHCRPLVPETLRLRYQRNATELGAVQRSLSGSCVPLGSGQRRRPAGLQIEYMRGAAAGIDEQSPGQRAFPEGDSC